MTWMRTGCGLALFCVLASAAAQGQADKADQREIRTYQLAHAASAAEANEVLTSVRVLTDPSIRLYLDPSTKSISVRAAPEQFVQIEKVLHDLDKPRKAYRITYIVTESDGGKKVGLQRFAMAAEAGERVNLKQGSRVPYSSGNQFSYYDVGLNFDTTPDSVDQGVQLKSKVEQSGVVEDRTNSVPGPPVIRQGTLEGISIVPLGKVTSLGAIDVPGSTRHVDIDVLVELTK